MEKAPKPFIVNMQRRIARVWMLSILLSIAGVFIPALFNIRGMEGGYAISFVSAFMVIVSTIVVVVYQGRAKQFDLLLQPENQLAVWHYTPEEWAGFVQLDYREEAAAKRKLFLYVAAISIVTGMFMFLAIGSFLFIPITAGIILLVAFPAILVPILRQSKLRSSGATVIICANGLIIGKMFHIWSQMNACLEEVILDTGKSPALIYFRYSYPSRNGRQEETARVPVPDGKETEAVEIVKHFSRAEKIENMASIIG